MYVCVCVCVCINMDASTLYSLMALVNLSYANPEVCFWIKLSMLLYRPQSYIYICIYVYRYV